MRRVPFVGVENACRGRLAAACARAQTAPSPEKSAMTPPLAVLLAALLCACGPGSGSGRPEYAAGLRGDVALARAWLAAGEGALEHPLSPGLPYLEAGALDPYELNAVALAVTLQGQRLEVLLDGDPAPAPFLELYAVGGRSPRLVDSGGRRLSYASVKPAALVLRLQPRLLSTGQYRLSVRRESLLRFPVLGGDTAMVRGFFGERRGGAEAARAHEGIDIVAPRGTPVVAVADGRVDSIEPNRLGGNVVWLRTLDYPWRVYYAHLEDVDAGPGQRVRAGEVLGTVGQSGNARTAHLHLGLYTDSKAVDPLPFIGPGTRGAPAPTADPAQVAGWRTVKPAPAVLRSGPGPGAPAVRVLEPGERLFVAAVTGASYRVRTPDGTRGFVSAEALSLAAAGPGDSGAVKR